MTAPTAERIREIRSWHGDDHMLLEGEGCGTCDLLAALDHVAERLRVYWYTADPIDEGFVPELLLYLGVEPEPAP